MKISICIPTWEQFGEGSRMLKDLFESISKQTFKNFDVVVSDQSIDNEIEKTCEVYKNIFEIKYIKNNTKRGNGPANTNNSIINADGDIIKTMFHDDIFYDKKALEKISEKFESKNINWLVTGCNHTYDDGETVTNFMIPRWNEEIVLGINTISSPSVLAFRNNTTFLFDENLTMLMDVEMYYQLYVSYGLPEIIEDCLITNRIHKNQISSSYSGNFENELSYVKTKHNLQ